MALHLPSVSVIIPVRNEARTIGKTLDTVLAMTYQGSLEVVVADAMSTDGTREIVRAFGPKVRLVDNFTHSTPAGLNRAIEVSTGDIILRCDAHSSLPPDYATTAVRLLVETGAANVGGIQKAVGTTPLQQAIAFSMTTRAGTGDAQFHRGGPAGPTDTVYLGVFRRDALIKVGSFDETLIRNQDYELNHRLKQAGEVVYFSPELSVEYQPRSSIARLASQYFQYGQWKRHVLTLHPGSLKARQLAPPALIAGLSGAVVLILAGVSWGWFPILAYGAALVAVAAAWTVTQKSLSALLMPLTLATMHLSWGAGFLRGRTNK